MRAAGVTNPLAAAGVDRWDAVRVDPWDTIRLRAGVARIRAAATERRAAAMAKVRPVCGLRIDDTFTSGGVPSVWFRPVFLVSASPDGSRGQTFAGI